MGRDFLRINLILLVLTLLVVEFQNCTGTNQVGFETQGKSLTSLPMAEGGGIYDGKPENGYYCRVYDNMSCQPQVNKLQSLIKADAAGLHLIQDNCASTSVNFMADDAAVQFNTLFPDIVGVSRGIFKKCQLGMDQLPLAPQEINEAYCVSDDNRYAAVINKNLISSEINLTMNFNSGTSIRSVVADNILKRVNADRSVEYSALRADFKLSIDPLEKQTTRGIIRTNIDNLPLEIVLNCRTSNPLPTVIVENDLELSSTWINTSQLVGYWKLNETNAVEGATIIDSSPYGAFGTLLTGADGFSKRDQTVANGALIFDGSNDFVSIPRPTDNHLDFDIRSFTFMAWIRTTGPTAAFEIPFFHGGSFHNMPGYDIECNSSGTCGACISDGNGIAGTSQRCATFGIQNNYFGGQWTLVTAVVDRSLQEFRTYANGVLVSTIDISLIGSVTDTTRGFYIGSNSNNSYPFSGSIDDVSIWNKALTPAEVQEIFQRLRPKFY